MSGFLPLLSTVSAADVATAVRAELATELTRIDVAISTRPSLTDIETAVIPVNIKRVNDTSITGTGTDGDTWGPV